MKKEKLIKEYGLSEDQFTGKEKINGSLDLSSLTSLPEGFNPTVGGDLYLSSLTSLPEGFNPTVGGYLDLRSLTSLPEGFNPTVGGDLDLSSLTSLPEGFNPTVGGSLDLRSLTSLPEGFNPTVGGSLYLRNKKIKVNSEVKPIDIKKDFFWTKEGKRYAKIDGLFCEILDEKQKNINDKKCTIFQAKKVNKNEYYFIVNHEKYFSHGKDLKKAFEDLEFKIASERLKKEPIKRDTIITMQYYRIITGACQLGCENWMEQNGIKKESIRADELLPILEKTSAYGLENFKRLIQF